jgi:hypothetical protein
MNDIVTVTDEKPDPFARIGELLGELAAEIDALPHAGNDQRGRAAEAVERFKYDLFATQLSAQ